VHLICEKHFTILAHREHDRESCFRWFFMTSLWLSLIYLMAFITSDHIPFYDCGFKDVLRLPSSLLSIEEERCPPSLSAEDSRAWICHQHCLRTERVLLLDTHSSKESSSFHGRFKCLLGDIAFRDFIGLIGSEVELPPFLPSGCCL
jgi:hypothetical protein